MKANLIFVRHGFSTANSSASFAGQTDVELSELGRKQAALCAKALKDCRIDGIYSSDLRRAHDTALPLAYLLSLPVISTPTLREINGGEWETLTFDEIRARYPNEYDVWSHDIGRAVCPGGESLVDMCARVRTAVTEIAEKSLGKTVALFTHAAYIRCFCTVVAGLPAEEMKKISWVGNASISRFSYENGRFTALSVDERSHLGELETTLPANA